VLTDGQVASLGGGKTPPVTVTVNDDYTFQGRVGRMGGENLVGFNRAVRAAAGVVAGAEIVVAIAIDLAPRAVEVPDDLAAALAGDGAAAAAFDRLAPSHRKEYVRRITEAKKPETRARRVEGTLERLRESKALR
jgi:hypothetical protein